MPIRSKIILAAHQKHKGKRTINRLKVSMTQVPYALNFAGYTFDKDLLNELFGSSSEIGKTVKKLRDETTHGVNEEAVKEIVMRKDELFGYMDSFLLGIRNFDKENNFVDSILDGRKGVQQTSN